jgi:hypothetical protein
MICGKINYKIPGSAMSFICWIHYSPVLWASGYKFSFCCRQYEITFWRSEEFIQQSRKSEISS